MKSFQRKQNKGQHNILIHRLIGCYQWHHGQPIIIGHHSEKKARRLHERAWKDTKKSIEEDKKSEYYKNKAKTVENSKVIYNDAPNAIQKLKDKFEYLEKQKELIKADEDHTSWQLQNIGARIREIKRSLARLEKLDEIEFNEIEFNGRGISIR